MFSLASFCYIWQCVYGCVCARACVSLCLFSLFFSFFVISILYENVRNSLKKKWNGISVAESQTFLHAKRPHWRRARKDGCFRWLAFVICGSVYVGACVSLCLFSLFFSFFVISILYENVRNSLKKKSKKKKKSGTGLYIQLLLRSRYEKATPNFCWVFCAINKREFEISFVSTHICLALRRLLTFCLTLTH